MRLSSLNALTPSPVFIDPLKAKLRLGKALWQQEVILPDLVLCHGCFDILHLGHIVHLMEARDFGKTLCVSITDDPFVMKGPERPVFTAYERALAVAALEAVTAVVVSSYPTAVEAISALRPRYYVKGPEYAQRGSTNHGRLPLELDALRRVEGEFCTTKGWYTNSSTALALKLIRSM